MKNQRKLILKARPGAAPLNSGALLWPVGISSWVASKKQMLFLFLFAAAVAGLLIAVQKVPEWQVKRASVRLEGDTKPIAVANLQNEMRKTFVQVLGGVFVVLALYLTYRRTKVTEQGHITDRYTKAIEQLGVTKEVKGETKPNVEVRLGAIYALERIALDSPRDHHTIMAVLTAYVRENAPAPETEQTEEENKRAIAKGPPTEIQAIMTVLGRRRRNGKREQRGQWLDLRRCDLRGANLRYAHLERAYFGSANIEGANFRESHMEQANFRGASAEGANFCLANLEEARFSGAKMKKADFEAAHMAQAEFTGTHLEGANFSLSQAARADFTGAHLDGADMTYAHLEGANFSIAQLERAHFGGACVQRANFGGAGMRGACFNQSNLEGAFIYDATVVRTQFVGANGLTPKQVGEAKGWEDALYDREFALEMGLKPSEDIDSNWAPRVVRPSGDRSAQGARIASSESDDLLNRGRRS